MTLRFFSCGAALAIVAVVSGCAAMRAERVPPDLTIDRAFEVLENHQNQIRDFTASARVMVTSDEGSERATVQVLHRAPDLFRLFIRGFAGIDVARVSALADSVTVWVPPENYWFSASRESPALARLVPQLGIGFDTLGMAFSSALPSGADRSRYDASLAWEGPVAVLVLRDGDAVRRVYLEGRGLRVKRDEYYNGNELVWRKEVESFKTVKGISFPEKMTISSGTDHLELLFSGITVNTGLTEKSLLFSIPNSVERISVDTER